MNNGNSNISRNNRAITKQNKMDDELSSLHGELSSLHGKIEGISTKIDEGFQTMDKGLQTIGQKIDDGFNGFKLFFQDLFSKYFPINNEKEANNIQDNNNQKEIKRDSCQSAQEEIKIEIEKISKTSSNKSEEIKKRSHKNFYWRPQNAKRINNKRKCELEKGKTVDSDKKDNNSKFFDNNGKYYDKNDTISSLSRKYQNELKKKR